MALRRADAKLRRRRTGDLGVVARCNGMGRAVLLPAAPQRQGGRTARHWRGAPVCRACCFANCFASVGPILRAGSASGVGVRRRCPRKADGAPRHRRALGESSVPTLLTGDPPCLVLL